MAGGLSGKKLKFTYKEQREYDIIEEEKMERWLYLNELAEKTEAQNYRPSEGSRVV